MPDINRAQLCKRGQMKRMLILVLMFPLALSAQPVLTGSWRLKESEILKGPDYTNALPLLITIRQQPEMIVLETTSSDGQEDTMVKESIAYGTKNESITKTGKKKIVSFYKGEDSNSWVKLTELFTNIAPGKPQSVNKERFTVWPGEATLNLLREYDGNDDPLGNQDFVISGTYEKVTAEQLMKEKENKKGVNFIDGLLWEQIKVQAQKENKYIFVDCYATWCRPCKMMDKYVYPLKSVGKVMNDQFIAVKVQMDTTKNDAGHIKAFYPLARKLEAEYNISVLPTYLFFSPDGKAVHKATGQQDAESFIALLTAVRDPEHQLYTLVNKARKRELPWEDYPGLAKRLKEKFGEKELAIEVAALYNQEYLNELSEKELLTKMHLDFIGQYVTIVHSSHKIFKLCLKQPRLIDSIKQYMGGGWAEYIVNRTINREQVDPILRDAEKAGNEPDWVTLELQLVNRYDKERATTYVRDARVGWYEKKKDWTAYLQWVRPHLARHDLEKINGNHLHYCAWYVFKYATDTTLMKEALVWMDILIEKWDRESAWMVMDTKACLLYKIGRKEESFVIMKEMIRKYPQYTRNFQSQLERMIRGEAIWMTR